MSLWRSIAGPVQVAIWSCVALATLLAVPAGVQAADEDDSPVEIRAAILPASDKQPLRLQITAIIDKGYHIYSRTQPADGPLPTKIKVDEATGVTLGDFTSEPKPELTQEPKSFPGVQIEKHKGRVDWIAPLTLAAGADLEQLAITGTVKYQACDKDACLFPTTVKFTAKLAKSGVAPAGQADLKPFRAGGSHTELVGTVEPQQVRPGEKALLTLKLTPDQAEHYHLYWLADKDPQDGSKPTLITLDKLTGLTTSPAMASAAPKTVKTAGGDFHQYEQPVVFQIEIAVERGAALGERVIRGLIGYQACNKDNCDMPRGATFSASIYVAETTSGVANVEFKPTSYTSVATAAAEGKAFNAGLSAMVGEPYQSAITPDGKPRPAVDGGSAAASTTESDLIPAAANVSFAELSQYLLAAFAAGLILNLMPCVLPVIGLKIFAFVKQSGENRFRIFSLNLWYSLGILSVFMVLATLVYGLNMAWGEQFTRFEFRLGLACLVWVMALSFLGVWDIPIPGFATASTMQKAAAEEGLFGTYVKGIVTTLLATPCSGPFWGATVAFTAGKPAYVVYSVFASCAFGMASPYLLIGLFPQSIRFLPKPGEWMDTFKQFLGFVMLGGVVLFVSAIKGPYMHFVFTLLIGLWMACWLIGRISLGADRMETFRGYAVAVSVALVIGALAYVTQFPHASKINWKPFVPELVQVYQQQGKMVVIDFTADWCLNCKAIEKAVLETDATKAMFEKHNVVSLKADWTDENEEIRRSLQQLGASSIPLTVIYPAGLDSKPILLRDIYNQAALFEALETGASVKPSQEGPQIAELPALSLPK